MILVLGGPEPKKFTAERATRDISRAIFAHLLEPILQWSEYRQESIYRFVTPYNEAIGRAVWERTMADRFSDRLHNLRERARKISDTEDTVTWKVHCPTQIRQSIWDALYERWADPRWRYRLAAGSVNWGKVLDANIHTGGSINFMSHKQKMKKERCGLVSYRELYEKTHKRKGTQEYITRRSDDMLDSYDQIMRERYREDLTQHP